MDKKIDLLTNRPTRNQPRIIASKICKSVTKF